MSNESGEYWGKPTQFRYGVPPSTIVRLTPKMLAWTGVQLAVPGFRAIWSDYVPSEQAREIGDDRGARCVIALDVDPPPPQFSPDDAALAPAMVSLSIHNTLADLATRVDSLAQHTYVTSESLPTPESVIDGTCKSGSPYARALAAIETIWNWFDLQKEWRALDDYTAANWQPGDTKIRLRESLFSLSSLSHVCSSPGPTLTY